MRQTPNAQRQVVNVVGSSTYGRYPKISSETTWNLYESDGWMVSFAGYKRVLQLLTGNSGQGRGLFHSIRANCIIAVVNSSVFRIDVGLTVTPLGSLATSSGEVYMDENLANQICIVDGLNAYIYNHSGAAFLTQQTFTHGVINPSYVTYINTYFVFGNANTTSTGSKWDVYLPSPSNPTLIEWKQTLSLQTKPDYAVAVKRIPGQSSNVLVFGTSVCEIWTQTASAGINLFLKNQSVNIDYGCVSIATIASCDQYIAWLGINESNAPVITVFSSQGVEQISTDGINYTLSGLKYPSQSTATFYRKDGHLFYQLTFYNPADNITFVYDFETKKFYNLSDSNLDHHPAIDVIYFNQKSYFLSLNNASMYELSTNLTTYDENINGEDPALIGEIPRIRVCAPIRHPDSSQFRANGVYMMIEQGYDSQYVGLNQNSATLNYVPRIDLAVSADSGVTWSNYVSRDMQPEGFRQNITTWEKLGAFNDLTLKFRFQGLSHFCVNNSYCDIY